MPAVEIHAPAPHVLRQTCVNNCYVVSTIRRRSFELDDLLATLTELIGDIGRADLGTPGEFESMVFPGNDEDGITGWGELDFRRYETEDDAHDGHMELVAKWLEMPANLGS